MICNHDLQATTDGFLRFFTILSFVQEGNKQCKLALFQEGEMGCFCPHKASFLITGVLGFAVPFYAMFTLYWVAFHADMVLVRVQIPLHTAPKSGTEPIPYIYMTLLFRD